LVLSVVSAFYYIRVVRFIFFDTVRKPFLFLPVNPLAVFFLINCGSLLAYFVFYQPVLYITIGLAVSSLFI
jgi:NADH:ubiquinone oxidoreductase subunit 2 (subunit N)